MRVKLLLAVGLLAFATTPVAADPLPIDFEIDSDHAGLWAPGVTTNNHPYGLIVDRSNGVSNVLSWQAPSHDDGRTLLGYNVYRFPDSPSFPVVTTTIAASSTSFDDVAANFDGANLYAVTAMWQERSGTTTTESIASNLALGHPLVGAGGGAPSYPTCYPVAANLGQIPPVAVYVSCLIP